uniref:Flagella associated protein n=1 Tax=Tetraselmis sp. GSL018 TaxID=582737 RepID=A0A061QV58_9CHLO
MSSYSGNDDIVALQASVDNDDEDDRSFLPPFANAENKELNRRVQGLEREVEQTSAALEDNVDRIKVMEEHLTNVQQELKFTQSRVDAKNREIEAEDHLRSLADREKSRHRKDIEQLQKEKLELQDKVNSLQNQLYKGNEKMDQFKLLMNWNQEELEQWALAARQKDEDDLALEKYQRRDEAKVKELNLHIEKLSKEVADMKQAVADEVTETQSYQIQLDKTADEFRRLHKERQDLVSQWDEAMETMRKRDEMIQVASERFAEMKARLRDKKGELDQQARFLDNEVANNRELDAQIGAYDREVAKLRVVYGREKEQVDEFINELDALKASLGKAANELAVKRSENSHRKQEIETKRSKLDAMRKNSVVANRKLDSEFSQLETMEQKVNELLEMQLAEEKRLKEQLKAVDEMKKAMFKKSQELFELRNKERDLIAEIAGGQAQNKNLVANISRHDAQVVKQQELLYNAEFQVQQLERKVQRAAGERTDDEKRALNARIEKLTAQLEGVNTEHSMLTEQVKLVEDALLKARRRNGSVKADNKKLQEQIQEIRLISDSGSRNLEQANRAKEDKMVEQDGLKLELERLRGILNLKADEVFSLENRKYQLKQSMEERKQEVQVHLEGLRAELKLVREDLHRVTLELRERELKVEKLQNKYETMTSKQKQEDGEENSQAYYVIKAAQEREELQRKGDDLDAKIRKAEKEVRALEKSLEKLSTRNSSYAKSFRRIDEQQGYEERTALRQKLDRAYDKLKLKRSEEKNVAGDIEASELKLKNLEMERAQVERQMEELDRKRVDAETSLRDQVCRDILFLSSNTLSSD